MAKQAELVQALSEQRGLVEQIGRETDGLLKRVKELEDAVANQPDATPELEQAVVALREQVNAVNDKVPDVQPQPNPPDSDIPADPQNPDADGVGVADNRARVASKGLSNKPSNV